MPLFMINDNMLEYFKKEFKDEKKDYILFQDMIDSHTEFFRKILKYKSNFVQTVVGIEGRTYYVFDFERKLSSDFIEYIPFVYKANCKLCAECCNNPPLVFPSEADDICKLLNISKDDSFISKNEYWELENKNCLMPKSSNYYFNSEKSSNKTHCFFLKSDKLCAIHSIDKSKKPIECMAALCGTPESKAVELYETEGKIITKPLIKIFNNCYNTYSEDNEKAEVINAFIELADYNISGNKNIIPQLELLIPIFNQFIINNNYTHKMFYNQLKTWSKSEKKKL